MPKGFQPHWSVSALLRSEGRLSRRWRICALSIVGVLLGYALPFYGFWLSIGVPCAMHVRRYVLWGEAAPRRPILCTLAWIGLWLPALSYYLTGWYWNITHRDLSSAWLLIPLCGPENMVVGTVVPALAATVVFAVGLVTSMMWRRPWLVMVGAWLAPWAHELAYVAVVPDVIC